MFPVVVFGMCVLISAYFFTEIIKLIHEIIDEMIEIRKDLSEIKKRLESPTAPKISPKFFTIKNGRLERLTKMELSGKEKISVAVQYADEFENNAEVEAASIEVTDPSLCSLVVGADGKSAEAELTGKAGSFKFKAKADAKLGEGEVVLEGESEEIIVKPGMAQKVKVAAVHIPMEPVPAPEEPPADPEDGN